MSDTTLMFDLLAKDSVSSKFSDISRSALASSGEMRAAFEKPIDVKIETEGFDTYMAKLEAVKAMNAGAIDDIHVRSSRMLMDMGKAERDLDGLLAMSDTELTKWANGGLKDAENGAAGASGKVGILTSSVAGLGIALGAPALVGGAAMLAGLVGILASATAAAAPFGLAVMGTVKDFTKQQQAVDAARSKLAGLTKGSAAYQKQLGVLHGLQQKFSAQFGPMSSGLSALHTAWDKFVKGARPTTVRVIGEALKVVADALPKMLPIVRAVGPAFNVLMKDLDKFIGSAAFKRFTSWVEKTGPSSILAVGHAIGKVAGAVMGALPHLTGLMHWVENMSGGKLAAIVGGIGALGIAIALLGGGPIAAVVAIAALGTALVIAYNKSKPFRQAVQSIWQDIQTKFSPILHQVAAWFHQEWPTIEKLGAQTLRALSGAFKSFVNLVAALWDKFGKGILDHAKNTIEGMLKVFKGAFQILGGIFQAVTDLLTGKWSHLGADLKRIASGFWSIIKGLFQVSLGNLVDTIRSHAGQITGFFHSLPGRVLGALGNLGGLLVHAGESIISGLADGIWNATVGKLGSTLSAVTGFIKAHKGPIEVDRVLLVPAGQAIMQGLIDGINAKKGELQTILGVVTGMVQKAGQQLQADMQARMSFQQGFVSTYASSAFGATNAKGNPAALPGMFAEQRSALDNALQLRHDTRKLISEGLSRSLLQQLANAGPSGLEQIHALASGSLAQVHRLNRLDRQTNRALGQAAHAAGGDLYGAKIAADRDRLRAEKGMQDAVSKAIKGEKIGEQIHKGAHDAIVQSHIEHLTKIGAKEGAALGSKAGAKELIPYLVAMTQKIENQAQQNLTKQRQHGGTRKKK